jgi:2-polyprenyl-3-methyl-5-hydroxy-6-metoxy-1,4-benzoquinol methylase
MFLTDHPKGGIAKLNENDLTNVESCGVCGCKVFERLAVYRENPKIHFIRCTKCGAVTYDKMLKQSVIDEMYDDDQYYDDTAEEGNVTFYGVERFGKHLLNVFRRVPIKEKCRILDFGGGDGAVSYALARMLKSKYSNADFDVTVVDYAKILFKSSDDCIKMSHVFPLDSIPASDKYDIIIASAVMEHIPTPKDAFLKLFSLVKNGGMIYFRTPYRYPLHKLAKHFNVDFDMLYPGHIWDFGGDKWWRKLPQIIGLENEIKVVTSRPSIVEKSFKTHFLIALASYILKAPWFICRFWPYVGGWETIYKKI